MRGSSLDKIEGVGEKRRSDLLRHFGTIENIRAASLEELARVVPRTVAEHIRAYYDEKSLQGDKMMRRNDSVCE